jgi:hypothetical protein
MMWRTDNWKIQAGPQKLDVMDTGETWMNAKPAA